MTTIGPNDTIETPPELLLWCDVETTGLNPATDHLLEVAAIITDPAGNELSHPFQATIRYPQVWIDQAREAALPFVRDMHDATGLWSKLPTGTELADVDAAMLEFVKQHSPAPRSARMAGNSVRLDLNFTEAFLPETYNHLHYRFVDVSGLAWVAERNGWVDDYYRKVRAHTALGDIRESIAEYRWLLSASRPA